MRQGWVLMACEQLSSTVVSASLCFFCCWIASPTKLLPTTHLFCFLLPMLDLFNATFSLLRRCDMLCLSLSIPYMKHKSLCFLSIHYYLFLYPFRVSVPLSITVCITTLKFLSPIILEAGHVIRRTFSLM